MIDLLFGLILALYLLATILYLAYLIKPKEILGRSAHWTISAGFLAHVILVLYRYFQAGYTPITNTHEALSFFSLCIVGVFIAFERKYKMFILGSFVVPVALLIMAGSGGFPRTVGNLNPALKSNWLAFHTILAFLGYASFTVAFGAGVMYIIQQRFLKKKKFGEMYRKLPSLETLDEINYRCLTFGFPALTLAIISGAIWAETAWGTYWSWDPKETWSLITWFVYAALLHGRLTTGWRGRKAAIFAIIGFFVLLFTFLGVNHLLTGLHSYK